MSMKEVMIHSFWFIRVWMKMSILVAFYLHRFQKYELVGPWRHDLDVKEKAQGPKPSASTSHPSSTSMFSSTSCSSATQNNNVEDPIVASAGQVSFDSDYTSDPVEVNKVHVERAKRRKAKLPCLQPLGLTRSQQGIANDTV